MAKEFDLFDFSPVYDLDQKELYKRYKEAQKRWHPDRPGGDQEKSAAIASAYRRLADDIERAFLVLECYGHKLPAPTQEQLELWMSWFENSMDPSIVSFLKNRKEHLVKELRQAFQTSDMKKFASLCLEIRYVGRILFTG